jgi:uncharacterized protein
MEPTDKRRALYLSVFIFALWLAIMTGGSLYSLKVENRSMVDELPNRVSPVLLAAVAWLLAATALLRWRKPTGLTRPKNRAEIALLWLPGVLTLGLLSTILVARIFDPNLFTSLNSGYLLVNLLLVGVSEELMFRGVIFHGVDSVYGWRRAVWVSALMFGVLHLVNGYSTGRWSFAALQAINATLIGVWLANLRLRMVSVLPGIGVHWIWNVSPLVLAIAGQQMQDAAGAAGEISPMVELTSAMIALACLAPFWVAFAFYNLRLLAGYQRMYAPDPSESVTSALVHQVNPEIGDEKLPVPGLDIGDRER